jgi:hypothetical protein
MSLVPLCLVFANLPSSTNLQAVCLIAYRLVRRDREIAAMGASGVSGLMVSVDVTS